MSKTPFRKPMPTGDYPVGMITYTVYNDREEKMFNALGTMRSIPVKIFYPTDKESVKVLDKAEYLSRETICTIKKQMHVPIDYEKVKTDGTNVSRSGNWIPKRRCGSLRKNILTGSTLKMGLVLQDIHLAGHNFRHGRRIYDSLFTTR